jgi:hypothetical protein
MKLLRIGGPILVEWLLRRGLKLITEYHTKDLVTEDVLHHFQEITQLPPPET